MSAREYPEEAVYRDSYGREHTRPFCRCGCGTLAARRPGAVYAGPTHRSRYQQDERRKFHAALDAKLEAVQLALDELRTEIRQRAPGPRRERRHR
jgi:hypothetical protein